jgi:hypothetical protein
MTNSRDGLPDGVAPPSKKHDARYWRGRAEESRARAEQMIDPVAKEAILKAAREYDRLADLGGEKG